MLVLLLSFLFVPTALAAPSEGVVAAAVDGPTLEAAVLSSAQRLDDAVSNARNVLLGLSSVKGNYAQYRKVEALEDTLRKSKIAIHEVNVVLPGSIQMAEQWEAEMTPARLKELFGRNTSDVERYAFSIKSDLETWSTERYKRAKAINDDARADLDQANTMLADPSLKNSVMGFLEMWVIHYHPTMLDAVDLFLPAPSDEPDLAIPLTAAELAERQRTVKIREDIKAIEAKVVAMKAAIAEAHRKKVAAARFPKGSPPKEAGVSKALAGEFGPPLRMASYAPWMVREQAFWRRGGWVVETNRYLTVWVAAKTPKGKTYVYLAQVVSQKNGGQWGPIRYRGVSDSYEILPENLME